MKRKDLFFGMLAMVLAFSLVLMGCATATGGKYDGPGKLAPDADGGQQIAGVDKLNNYCSSYSNSLGGSHYNFIKIGIDYIRGYTNYFADLWKGEYFSELVISSLNSYIDNLQINGEGAGSKPAKLSFNATAQQALTKLTELATYCDSHSSSLGGSRYKLIETGLHFIRVTISTGDCDDSVVISSLNSYIDNLQ
jgi:hypothetical protein